MFRVYDNEKPAEFPYFTFATQWTNCTFDTEKEAKEFAHKWLGVYSPGVENLHVGFPFDYSGFGDIVVIKEIK